MRIIIRDGKMYRLKSEYGKVSYLMSAGEHMVRGVMSEVGALNMMTNGTLSDVTEKYPETPICVGDKYYFPGKVTEEGEEIPEKPKKAKKEEK